ncbi:hypothetical protein [Candidatus Leptofilum sp.]|uniref:hypothetical protein n=1 Tax=Candidatus Leptofilum sp. TaxID=3241576 RepID=UPI003B5A0ABB
MNTNCTFYICPTCFHANEAEANCHGHSMIKYDACLYQGVQRKPMTDKNGRIKSRAPRWFLQATQNRQVVGAIA